MNVEIGWYMTVSGERAYVAALAPKEYHGKFYAERYFAIGWIDMRGTSGGHGDGDIATVWWNREGKHRVGNESGPHKLDLVSREPDDRQRVIPVGGDE